MELAEPIDPDRDRVVVEPDVDVAGAAEATLTDEGTLEVLIPKADVETGGEGDADASEPS